MDGLTAVCDVSVCSDLFTILLQRLKGDNGLFLKSCRINGVGNLYCTVSLLRCELNGCSNRLSVLVLKLTFVFAILVLNMDRHG